MTRDSLFYFDENASGSLKSQLRELIVNAILNGYLPPNSPLPSSRMLAKQLGISRNTVILTFQSLVDDGYLVSRERSGHYVNGNNAWHNQLGKKPHTSAEQIKWTDRIQSAPTELPHTIKPKNWRDFPYPFIHGQFDPDLFPQAGWNECVRESMATDAVFQWAGDQFDRDDEELINQIRTRLLPRRGIWAQEEEILITSGTQHAHYLITQLLVNSNTTVGMEEPGYFDARNILQLQNPKIVPLDVDSKGLKISDELDHCDLIYTTPSHHSPTTVNMPLSRRKKLLRKSSMFDLVIIEDGYEAENKFTGKPLPALKSLDEDNRVLFIGTFSKTLAPGLRLGYLVGPKAFIRQARALRRIMMRYMPANNQHIVAMFIKRGYHDALIHRMHREYKKRWQIMKNAIDIHLADLVTYTSIGGSSFWVKGPRWLDTDQLERVASNSGVLIERGSVFFMRPQKYSNHFRLGFSSIAKNDIEPGIKKLAQVIKKLNKE